MVDRHQLLARLDDRLERVGEARDDHDLQRGLAVVGAESRRRVGHARRGRQPHDARAEPLKALLQRREVLDRNHVAVADHHVRLTRDDRLHELGDVLTAVLVVGVGVHDHVGAELQRGVHAGLECARQPLVVRQAHDVADAVGARDGDRVIARPVVDHENLDRIEPGKLAGEVGERRRKLLRLVLAGNLDDQLHRVRPSVSVHDGAVNWPPSIPEKQDAAACRSAWITS